MSLMKLLRYEFYANYAFLIFGFSSFVLGLFKLKFLDDYPGLEPYFSICFRIILLFNLLIHLRSDVKMLYTKFMMNLPFFKGKNELYNLCAYEEFVMNWGDRNLDTFILYTGNDHKEEDVETPLHRAIREKYSTANLLYLYENNEQHKGYALIWAFIYNFQLSNFVGNRHYIHGISYILRGSSNKEQLPLINIESIMSKRYLSKVNITRDNMKVLENFSNYYEFINLNRDFILTHCKEVNEDDFEMV